MSWLGKLFGVAETKRPEGRERLEIPANTYKRIYAIGDIHGRLDLLQSAEERIAKNIPQGERGLVVLVGDYVDRGPNSSGVLRHLCEESDPRFDRVCLCGNHDDTMLGFLTNPLEHMIWLKIGGTETLLSYGIDADYILGMKNGLNDLKESMKNAVPQRHVEFLKAAPVSVRVGDLLFVHAGVEPGVALDEQSDLDMMWIREPFISSGPDLPIFVIHGHTPFEEISFGPRRIGIDTGAYNRGKLPVLLIVDGIATII